MLTVPCRDLRNCPKWGLNLPLRFEPTRPLPLSPSWKLGFTLDLPSVDYSVFNYAVGLASSVLNPQRLSYERGALAVDLEAHVQIFLFEP